jgi:hypothetical protein
MAAIHPGSSELSTAGSLGLIDIGRTALTIRSAQGNATQCWSLQLKARWTGIPTPVYGQAEMHHSA